MMQLAEDSSEYKEYVEMLNAVEINTTNLLKNSELRQLASYRDRLSVEILSSFASVTDETEKFIPRPLRPKMMDILHFINNGDDMIWK